MITKLQYHGINWVLHPIALLCLNRYIKWDNEVKQDAASTQHYYGKTIILYNTYTIKQRKYWASKLDQLDAIWLISDYEHNQQ